MNDNIVGRMTCPICHESSQDLKVNKNHKLYMFCDNGCTIKLNSAKSKRYLPVLLSGSDVKDDAFGLIISTCKGNKINEIIKQKEVRDAGNVAGSRANDNTGRIVDAGSVRQSTGSRIDGRTDGQHTARRTIASHESIIGRAAAWLADDDDD